MLDLLKDWDRDGDGCISQYEFRSALQKYGCPATAADIGAVFDAWDSDRSGSLSLIELYRILRRGKRHPIPTRASPTCASCSSLLNGLPRGSSWRNTCCSSRCSALS